ncbi:MAG: anthranilate synthase component I [Bacillota bacterium]
MNVYPDKNHYLALCRDYKSVPVSVEWPSDTETPITVYAKLAKDRPSFLLESVEGGERLGRYSFIGIDPHIYITSHRGVTTVDAAGQKEVYRENPFNVIEKIIDRHKAPVLDGLPRFYGGLVGYLGYDMVRHIERLPDTGLAEQGVPDCIMMAPSTVIIIDHLKHTMRLVVNTFPEGNPEAHFNRAVETLSKIIRKIARTLPPSGLQPVSARSLQMAGESVSEKRYREMVETAKEYIRAGDILQVVLSRRIDVDFKGDPFRVYRRLRRNNPSPYLYYINAGEVVIAGSSPEMLVRVENTHVETRPIAGTRPRGANRDEDSILAGDLLSDIKERAEHVMLVDLGRNDLGRISRPGTVKVNQFMEVEMYSHVMHIVSSVSGELREGMGEIDVLKACFPAGTVSGAPKVRAMEIIEELEPSRRGPYAGAVGYIGFNGNMDTAIAIRTVVFYKGTASVQAGAGIVADSDPAAEFRETENKARALINTLAEEDGDIAANY